MATRRSTRGAAPRARGRRADPKTPKSPSNRGRGAFRRQVVDLHRAIFQRNQKRINNSVSGYTAAFRRYEAEYAAGVQTYQRRCRPEELMGALDRAQIAYVGDYHTLPQAQRAFLKLLKRLPAERPVTVALEFIQGRHQAVIDAFMAGHISEARFLEDIGHTTHWVFGGWSGFRDILNLARERGYPVLGIDSSGRGPAGSTLRNRDRYAARRIARIHRQRPEDLIMVLVGELHISPDHLPAEVNRAAEHLLRDVVIYQNCEQLYWELERRGLEHEVELVRIRSGQYCLMNTPPIVCQQSFLNWLDMDEEGQHLESPEDHFKEYASLIASFFDIDLGSALDEVEITTVVDLSFLERLQRRGDFSDDDIATIHKQILASESYTIPRAKMVYLGNLSVNHAAEEATHFVRHVCSHIEEPKLLVDAFYARALEEAIGFFGSKLINHKRKAPSLTYFQRVQRSRSASPQERRVARLVVKHARMQSGERVRGATSLYECDADSFNAVTHSIGYQLGEKLYYAMVAGRVSKAQMRDLFFDAFEEEGDSITTYLYLAALTRDVRVPERL